MINRTWIPNGLTMASLFCGVLGILFVARAMISGGAGPDWYLATFLIGFAGLFDGLDGRFARILNASSSFGKELDALTDVVSMTLAPALLIYQRAFANDSFSHVWMVVTAVFVCCGAGRLARYNVEERRSASYIGMPTSAACAVMVGLAPLAPRLSTIVVAALVLLMAGLMISTLPFPTPEQCFFDSPMLLRIVLVVLFVVGAYAGSTWFYGTPLVYVLYGIALNAMTAVRRGAAYVRS